MTILYRKRLRYMRCKAILLLQNSPITMHLSKPLDAKLDKSVVVSILFNLSPDIHTHSIFKHQPACLPNELAMLPPQCNGFTGVRETIRCKMKSRRTSRPYGHAG